MTQDTILLTPEAWPAGHRAALAVVVELDPSPADAQRWPQHDDAGATHLLGMLADLDVAPTVVIDSGATAGPTLPEEMIVDGACWGTEALDLDAARAAILDRLGSELRGLAGRNPGTADPSLWRLSAGAAPFPERDEHGALLVRAHPRWNLATWFESDRPSPPSAMLESWSLGLASARTRGELLTITLPVHAAGIPSAVETVQRFLDEAVGAGDVWITSVTAVVRHVSSD